MRKIHRRHKRRTPLVSAKDTNPHGWVKIRDKWKAVVGANIKNNEVLVLAPHSNGKFDVYCNSADDITKLINKGFWVASFGEGRFAASIYPADHIDEYCECGDRPIEECGRPCTHTPKKKKKKGFEWL
jgi:hypothetical protein